MTELITSASKIVFILMALGAIAFTFTGHISGEMFMVLANGAFTYYYTHKRDEALPGAKK